mgnify:FL=1
MPPKSQSQIALDGLSEQISRHDERIKALVEGGENVASGLNELKKELTDLKISLESYKLQIENISSVWSRIFDAGWKIAIMVLGAFILYMLRLQS